MFHGNYYRVLFTYSVPAEGRFQSLSRSNSVTARGDTGQRHSTLPWKRSMPAKLQREQWQGLTQYCCYFKSVYRSLFSQTTYDFTNKMKLVDSSFRAKKKGRKACVRDTKQEKLTEISS